MKFNILSLDNCNAELHFWETYDTHTSPSTWIVNLIWSGLLQEPSVII